MMAIAAGLCLGPVGFPCAAEEPQSASKADRWSVWTGLSAGPDYIYAYDGAALFLAGNADQGGPMARLALGGGAYRTSGDHPHDVIQYDANFMLGYRAPIGGAMIALFAGGDVNRHDNDDRDAKPRGTEFGAKGLLEAYAPLGPAFYLAGYGTYSTAFDTFSSDLKLAYRLTERFAVGPEMGAVGSAGFAQARAGLASAWKLGEATELAGAAGAGWDLDDSHLGFYGLLNLDAEF
jgi:hypothetical protein